MTPHTFSWRQAMNRFRTTLGGLVLAALVGSASACSDQLLTPSGAPFNDPSAGTISAAGDQATGADHPSGDNQTGANDRAGDNKGVGADDQAGDDNGAGADDQN